MSLPKVFPFYSDGINGPHHVSLALPGKKSQIMESIGVTASSLLLVPQIEYIKKFVEGDLGISDTLYKSVITYNFSAPQVTQDEEAFRRFAKVCKIDLEEDISKYKKDGRFVMPNSKIKINPALENIGLKSVEKTILKSIFETQKPYIEITKLITENLAYAEDIVARVMPLISPSPLTAKSEKPNSNAGNTSRPKSMGFGGGKELKDSLSKLETLINDKKPESLLTGLNDSAESSNTSDTSGKWQVTKTIYSTGEFDPNLDYIYKYVDLPDDEIKFDEKKSTLDLNDIDPFQKYKPKKLILGIYNSNGQPLNPNQPIKTYALNGLDVTQVDTPFKKADWILDSPKWYLPNGVYSWPTYDQPVYVWEKGLFRRESKTNPDSTADPAWKIKKYKEGDKDLLTKDDAFPGNPVIARFETNEINEYRDYFDEFLNFRFHKTDSLSKEEKDKTRKDLLSRLDIQSHLQNVYLYGQNKSSTYKQINGKDPIPVGLKKVFKPYKIFSKEAAVDEEIKNFSSAAGIEPGFLWIEPEADYDMKVIRIDPVSKVGYKEAQTEDESFSEIRNFVKNNLKIRFSNNIPFTIEIKRKDLLNPNFTLAPEITTNVASYNLENWNFENLKVINNRNLSISVYSEVAPIEYINNQYLRVEGPASENTIINFNFYELKKEGNFYYYRKLVYKIDPKLEAVRTFLKYANQNLLNDLSSKFDKGEVSQYTFTIEEVIEDPNSNNNNTIFPTSGLIGEVVDIIQGSNSNQPQTRTVNYTVDLKTIFSNKEYSYFEPGDISLWIGVKIEEKYQKKVNIDSTGKILKWYYINDRNLEGPDNKLSPGTTLKLDSNEQISRVLPTFGVEREFIIEYDTKTTLQKQEHSITYSDKSISLYNIKIGNADNSQKLIDPSKVTNSQLKSAEIFGFGKQGKLSKYGHGSPDDPQELLIIERYRLTDLDTESYYIIEGTLRNPPTDGQLNLQTTNNDDTNYYRLPDAIGAVKSFLSMLANIFAKLVPQLTKLIELFKSPTSFLTNIISDKAGENVEFLNKKSLDSLKQAARMVDEIKSIKNITNEKLPDLTNLTGQASNLAGNLTGQTNNIAENINQQANKAQSIKNQVETIRDQKQIENLKKQKVRDLNKFIKTSPMSNYIHVKDDGDLISILDGSATIPFNIFGNSINFGIDMQLNRVTEKKTPLKLIFEKDLKLKNIKNLQSELELRKFDNKQPELKSQIQDNLKSTDFEVKFSNGSSTTVESSSINSFIINNKNKYNFIILEEDSQRTYKKIDDLVEKGTPEDLRNAKDLIDKAKKQNPKDINLLNKEKFITDKLGEFQLGDQPMLKFILGIVSLPFKLIAGVLEYIMNFFKSLINPVTLPAKLLEFLSFSWIAKFFTPKGVLEMAGIRFAPEKLAEWKGLVNIPGPIPNIPKSTQLPDELKKLKDLENNLTNQLNQQTGNLTNQLNQQTGNLKNQLNQQTGNLTNQLNQQTGNLKNQLNQQTGNLTNQLNQQTGNLTNQLNQQTGNLTNQINQQTGNLTNQLNQQTGNLTNQLNQNLGSLNNQVNQLGQSVNGQTQGLTNNINQINSNLNTPNIPNINLPKPEIPLPKIPDLPKSLNLPEDIRLKGFDRKNIKSGDYLFPDDIKLVDMSQFLNVIFNVKLPEYSSIQFRQNPNIGGSLIGQLKINKPNLNIPNAPEVPNLPGFSCGGGFLCFVEALINSIINFVWSLLGIEAVIEAPQVKLCNGKKPKDAADIQKNSKNDQDLDGFYYEVQLENGKTQKFLNYEELQSFIDDNKGLNYDFNF
jgi:methyl-accepting chemotaxis protein